MNQTIETLQQNKQKLMDEIVKLKAVIQSKSQQIAQQETQLKAEQQAKAADEEEETTPQKDETKAADEEEKTTPPKDEAKAADEEEETTTQNDEVKQDQIKKDQEQVKELNNKLMQLTKSYKLCKANIKIYAHGIEERDTFINTLEDKIKIFEQESKVRLEQEEKERKLKAEAEKQALEEKQEAERLARRSFIVKWLDKKPKQAILTDNKVIYDEKTGRYIFPDIPEEEKKDDGPELPPMRMNLSAKPKPLQLLQDHDQININDDDDDDQNIKEISKPNIAATLPKTSNPLKRGISSRYVASDPSVASVSSSNNLFPMPNMGATFPNNVTSTKSFTPMIPTPTATAVAPSTNVTVPPATTTTPPMVPVTSANTNLKKKENKCTKIT